MSRFITNEDACLGYSSDHDEFEMEFVQTPDVKLNAEQHEIYIGNTGRVDNEKFYNLVRSKGFVEDMVIWRSHNILYHARILYKKRCAADQAIKDLNGTIYMGKRLRVSYVNSSITIDFPAALRIEDLCENCTEEDVYDHFASSGEIIFVVRTGSAAYVQFKTSSAATTAMGIEPILNGDPYTISRIFADDRVNHSKVLASLKEIKYRKPFVMVENYPAQEKGVPLSRYKACFESIGPVLHFKIAPTGSKTVTLALCMEKPEHRALVIDKFNNTTVESNVLKLYLAPGKASMTIHHAATYASCKNTIVVTNIPPYYKDYNVCKMFGKCGEINFLERFEGKWLICFESHTAVSLAHYFQFMSHKQRMNIVNLTPETLPGKTPVVLQDAVIPKEPEKKLVPTTNAAYWQRLSQTIDEQIKNKPLKTIVPPVNVVKPQSNTIVKKPPVEAKVATKPQEATKAAALSEQAKLIAAMFKNQDNLSDVKATPVAPEKPKPIATEEKQEAAFSTSSGSVPRPRRPEVSIAKQFSSKNSIYMGNLAKGITELDLAELFSNRHVTDIRLYCSKDSYHPSATAFVAFESKTEIHQVLQHHHERFREKRVIMFRTGDIPVFFPEKTVMIKNLTPDITEEALFVEIEKVIGLQKVVDIVKPAHHYAYIDFKENVERHKIVEKLRRAFTPFKIDIFTLYRSIPKKILTPYAADLRPKSELYSFLGLAEANEIYFKNDNFGPKHAHELFVGNIPRDSLAEDVIDYFNNFGNVVDYKPIEKKSCYLRKSAIITFENAKHALHVFNRTTHYFEGSVLELHVMDMPPYMFKPDSKILTVKYHSPFLTSDEVREAVVKYVNRICYCLRFDAFDDRANCVLRYSEFKKGESFEKLVAEVNTINDESVLFVDGLDLIPPLEGEAVEHKQKIMRSMLRQRKEQFLSYVSYKENLKDDLEMRLRPATESDLIFKTFYNDNSVQINNVSLRTTIMDIRDLFYKCGEIVDYQAVILEEDETKICYVKFNTNLAADLACNYNQRRLNGTRILIHLATETLRVERDRTVQVERFNRSVKTEDIYEVFSSVGLLKYVQKQSPFSAVVCYKEPESMHDAISMPNITNSNNFIIRPCCEDYNSRFYDNFTMREEYITLDKMRLALKPRLRAEYNMVEMERQVFDTFSVQEKTQLINEVHQARQEIPNFDKLNKSKQITALLIKYPKFTQKDNFLRLTLFEQEKLLSITANLKEGFSIEESKEITFSPPPEKITRKETDQTFVANWYDKPKDSPVEKNDSPVPAVAQPVRTNVENAGLLGHLEPQRTQKTQRLEPQPAQFGSNQSFNIPPQNVTYGNTMYGSGTVMSRPNNYMIQNMQPQQHEHSGHWTQQMASMAYNATPYYTTFNQNRPY